MNEFRVGQGYDVHRLVPDRPLILGGVQIPSELGLLGHSDADVLLHAVTDALLGAAGLGDIGRHFPDTDPAFAGADSRHLLQTVLTTVLAAGWRVMNVDCTVIAQKPRLADLIESISGSLAETLGLARNQVNVKAKTNEKLGYLGRCEAIEAQAVLLLVR